MLWRSGVGLGTVTSCAAILSRLRRAGMESVTTALLIPNTAGGRRYFTSLISTARRSFLMRAAVPGE